MEKTLKQLKEREKELQEGRTPIKCDYEKSYKLVKDGNVKRIKETFYHIYESYELKGYSHGKLRVNELGGLFLDTIKDNSNDFTKDIAAKCIEKEFELSEKQMWCLAYQIVNNKEVYLQAILDEWDDTTKNMEVDDVISKKDIELNRIGFEIFTLEIAQ